MILDAASYYREKEKNMWYIIQTIAGKEQDVVDSLEKLVSRSMISRSLYECCFTLRREYTWRADGKYKLCFDILFPGYVFIITDKPEELFHGLKKITGFIRILGEEDGFFGINPDEQEFLENLIQGDPDYIVRRSMVKVDGNGRIIEADGPLKPYVHRIVKQRLRKGIVYIDMELAGKRRCVSLGIRLEGDER